MNEMDLGAAVERLMGRVDYYLHCELDDQYDHERPDTARSLLETAIRQELQRAGAIALMSAVVQSARSERDNDLTIG
ncbi:MAG: hypothetical protein JWQ03_752 [Variovorax sp.]|nr:hypothetical protein [Variovorax sp.]